MASGQSRQDGRANVVATLSFYMWRQGKQNTMALEYLLATARDQSPQSLAVSQDAGGIVAFLSPPAACHRAPRSGSLNQHPLQ